MICPTLLIIAVWAFDAPLWFAITSNVIASIAIFWFIWKRVSDILGK